MSLYNIDVGQSTLFPKNGIVEICDDFFLEPMSAVASALYPIVQRIDF